MIGEKQRWVPIPAEELRAAADAHRSAQASHSRSQSQQRSQTRAPGSSSGRSNRPSQERSSSNAPSSGVRGSDRDRPQNAYGSVPQSEAHSRTASLQSSPKHASARLRKFAEQDITGPSSRRSSRTSSACRRSSGDFPFCDRRGQSTSYEVPGSCLCPVISKLRGRGEQKAPACPAADVAGSAGRQKTGPGRARGWASVQAPPQTPVAASEIFCVAEHTLRLGRIALPACSALRCFSHMEALRRWIAFINFRFDRTALRSAPSARGRYFYGGQCRLPPRCSCPWAI